MVEVHCSTCLRMCKTDMSTCLSMCTTAMCTCLAMLACPTCVRTITNVITSFLSSFARVFPIVLCLGRTLVAISKILLNIPNQLVVYCYSSTSSFTQYQNDAMCRSSNLFFEMFFTMVYLMYISVLFRLTYFNVVVQ